MNCVRLLPIAALLAATAACTSVPERSGLLSDYSRQSRFDGRLSKRAAARPLSPPPVDAPLVFEVMAYAPGVEAGSRLPQPALDLVLNRFARDLCARLAPRFAVAGDAAEGPQPDTYRLRAFVTEVRPTGRLAAAASLPLSMLSPVGGRVPIGLGALSAEVELLGPDGVQVASMTWRRAATAADSGAAITQISDAYQLAGEAAESFGQVMADQSPGALKRLQSSGLIGRISLGKADPECARYGSGPGLMGSAVTMLTPGMPPEWVDRGAAQTGTHGGAQWVDGGSGSGQTRPASKVAPQK